jgi:hypothetical protein
MAKGAFGQKQGVGALVMQWPKEEGSDFAGHEMAKEEDPTSLAIAWPKRATPLHGQREPHPSLATYWPPMPPHREKAHPHRPTGGNAV